MTDKIQNFMDFARKHDLFQNEEKLKLQWSQERGFHCIASKDLKKNEELFRIPRKILISKETAKEALDFRQVHDELQSRLDEATGTLQEEMVLLLYLMFEKSKGSTGKWWSYLDILPEKFPSPLFWSSKELESRLAGSPLYGLVEETRIELENAWKWVESLPLELPGTLQDFLWAYCVIQSRAYRVGTQETQVTALVPLADFSNHTSYPKKAMIRNLHIIDPSTDCLIAKVNPDLDFPIGSEMTMHYNDLANWQLLLFYGFVESDNPFERVNISLDQDLTARGHLMFHGNDDEGEDDLDLELRKMLLLQVAGEAMGLGFDHSLGYDEIPSNLWASLRLLLAKLEELDGMTVNNLANHIYSPLSQENESRCKRCLQHVLTVMLEGYPTTLEQDLEVLSELGYEDAMARSYIIEQKSLLHNLLQRLDS